jgi:hypothetical protein
MPRAQIREGTATRWSPPVRLRHRPSISKRLAVRRFAYLHHRSFWACQMRGAGHPARVLRQIKDGPESEGSTPAVVHTVRTKAFAVDGQDLRAGKRTPVTSTPRPELRAARSGDRCFRASSTVRTGGFGALASLRSKTSRSSGRPYARVVFLGRAGTPDLRVRFRSADRLDALTRLTFGSVHGFSLYISRPVAAAAARMFDVVARMGDLPAAHGEHNDVWEARTRRWMCWSQGLPARR